MHLVCLEELIADIYIAVLDPVPEVHPLPVPGLPHGAAGSTPCRNLGNASARFHSDSTAP